jgi:peroxiredoxin
MGRLTRLLTGLLVLAAVAVALGGPVVAAAEPGAAASVGKVIPPFTLRDTAGKPWALADARDAKAVVVVFVGTQCPINNAFMPRLAELQRAYAPKGVAFVAINANVQDTPDRIREHTKKHALPFPVLRDEAAGVADQFGAQRTPEAFVLDATRKVCYQGRIDDQFGIGFQRPQPTRRDLAEALDDVLAGKAVRQPTSAVAGCVIARPTRQAATGTVTFSKDVARILQQRCQECHRPGQIGPMPLLTYDDAAAWAATIREVIEERRMPPWLADSRHGTFRNSRRLSDAERTTLLAWIDQGCPRGDDRELPEPKQFAEGWTIGKPDAVFTMGEDFAVPARTTKEGVRYQYFQVMTNFDQDMWVQAAEAKPGNRAVVHHIIVFVMKPGQKRGKHEDGIGNGFLVGYAPGDMGVTFPAGAAKKIPKGSMLVFQMHYTPNGSPQTDRSSVGLVFAKEPPRHEVRTRGIAQQFFMIPPGAADHKVTSRTTFSKDVLLWSLLPHMHLRGNSFQYQVVFPDGKTEILLSVPRYDFGWQSNYVLTEPRRLPAGTRIDCTAFFDNSAGNPNNPDPTAFVRWGDQTWEEMMIGFVDYTYLAEDGAKR